MVIIKWCDREKNIVKEYIEKVEENKSRESVDWRIEFIGKGFWNCSWRMEVKRGG